MGIRSRGIRRIAVLLSLALLIGAVLSRAPIQPLLSDASRYLGASPHERYAAELRLRRVASRIPGARRWSVPAQDVTAWLDAAEHALATPAAQRRTSFSTTVTLNAPGAAASWRFPVRRGYRLVVDYAAAAAVFVDLFDADSRTRLASADGRATVFQYDANADGDLVLRTQSTLDGGGDYRISVRANPSVQFPVEHLTPRAVQSRFGATRDAGRRLHEGIDIFAPRGTPVVAATDGWIGSSMTNGLGGNVVWVWSPLRGVNTYYAHLDRQAVSPGQRVIAGDVVGYVGNTGNARGGPTHLHFGVYVTGQGSVDPLPYVCGDACFGGDGSGRQEDGRQKTEDRRREKSRKAEYRIQNTEYRIETGPEHRQKLRGML